MGSKDKSLTLRAIDRDAQLQLVDVAKAGGVQHFVYTSASPNLDLSAPLVRYKREVERAVRASVSRQVSCTRPESGAVSNKRIAT